MSIFERQNQPHFITLLGAQKQLYIEAKRIKGWIFFSTLFFAIAIPVANIILPSLEDYFSVLAGIASALIAIFLDKIPGNKAELAARIQEQIDTELYNLPWNKALAKEKVSERIITEADLKLRDRSNLPNWYSDYSNLEYSHEVLECQQENLYWDSTQRWKYVGFLSSVAGIIFFIGYMIGFYRTLSLWHYTYQIFIPQLGLFIHILLTALDNIKSSDNLLNKLAQTKALADIFKRASEPISVEILRDIQDTIFENRKNGSLVPEWFYKRIRPWLERVTKTSAQNINQ